MHNFFHIALHFISLPQSLVFRKKLTIEDETFFSPFELFLHLLLYRREQHIKWGENCISLLLQFSAIHLERDASRKKIECRKDNDDDNVKCWLYYVEWRMNEWILWSYISSRVHLSTNAGDLSYYQLLSLLLEPNTLMLSWVEKIAIQFRIESTIAVIISIFYSI